MREARSDDVPVGASALARPTRLRALRTPCDLDGRAWTAGLATYGAMTIRDDDLALTTEMFDLLLRG